MRVVFEPKTFVDIILAALICDVEVSGLAKVRRDGLIYTIYDEPIVFDQKCSLSGTTFDEIAFPLWQEKMVLNGRGDEIQEAKLWWHSHVWSDVYFSAIDEATLKVMGQNYDWWLAMVVNKLAEVYMELRTYKPQILPGELMLQYDFTEKVSPASIQRLMDERMGRMIQIIKDKVVITPEPGLDNYYD